jgi:hypothetical protein
MIVGLGAAPLAFALAASCTIFDNIKDVPAPGADAGSDITVEAAPEPDTGADAGPTLPSYLSLEDAARLCSLAYRCPELPSTLTSATGIPLDPQNYSDCMTWLAGPIPPTRIGFQLQATVLACMANAATCQAASSCGLIETILPGDPRCADAGPDASDRCDDNGATVIRCNGRIALHCGNPYYGQGSTCLTGDEPGSYWCSTGENCTISASCLGSVLDYCGTDTLRNSINCAAIGTACAFDTDAGLHDCLTEGIFQPCETLSSGCKGDAVEVCNGDRKSLFNCKDINGTCVNPQGTARCTRPDDRCTPFDLDVNLCNGSTFHLCIGGKPVDFDCAAVGLSCKPSAGAVPAQCAP